MAYVFSDTQLPWTAMRTRNRDRKAEEAYEHRCESAAG